MDKVSDLMDKVSDIDLKSFLAFVRSKSEYYRELWAHVPEGVSTLDDLPLIDVDEYWKASKEGRLLTGPFVDGMPVRTGGSTSEPKVLYMTTSELDAIITNLAESWPIAGMVEGDRIANLAHIGGMYLGYTGVTLSLAKLKFPHIHLPITGNEPIPNIAGFMKRFDATIVISNVFTVCRVVDYLNSEGRTIDTVRLCLFFGEAFHKDLRASFFKAFPNTKLAPCLYGAMDGGILGIPITPPGAVVDSDIKPVYRVNRAMIDMEIVGEDGSVIKEPFKRGRVMVTNLTRFLFPVVRYPPGDMAHWVDYEKRHFELLGRDSIAVKMGSLHLELPTLKALVTETLGEGFNNRFQTVVRRSEGKGQVIFRFAGQHDNHELVTKTLEANLIKAFPRWQELLDVKYVQHLKTEWVKHEELVYIADSGKLRDVVEERF